MTERLVRRGSVYYFRMAVPRSLVARVGRRELTLSLQTTQRPAATRMCRQLSNAIDRFFEMLPKTKTTIEQVNDALKLFFQDCLNVAEERAQEWPDDPVLNIEDEIAAIHQSIVGYRQQITSRKFSNEVIAAATTITQLVKADGSTSLIDAERYAKRGVVWAKIDADHYLASELSGQPAPPRHELFTGMVPNTLPHPGGPSADQASQAQSDDPDEAITLGQLVDRYRTTKFAGKLSPKTESDLKYTMQIVYNIIPATRLLASIATKDVREVRDLIMRLPPNAQKKKPLFGNDLLALAKDNENGPKLAYKTQDKRLTFFQTMLRWAVEEGYLASQPGSNIKIPTSAKSPTDGRKPYSEQQLAAIFASPVYTGRKTVREATRPGPVKVADGKYWIPLIALYSGMRLGEIVQLLPSDIIQKDGVWCFSCQYTEGAVKKLKTAAAIRIVPIHQRLIELGLLKHVEQTKSGQRIFQDATLSKNLHPSENFSKWWTRYAQIVGFAGDQTAFHSFRHNFTDALRDSGAAEYAMKAILGHADTSITGGYGTGVSAPQLKKVVDGVSYPVEQLEIWDQALNSK